MNQPSAVLAREHEANGLKNRTLAGFVIADDDVEFRIQLQVKTLKSLEPLDMYVCDVHGGASLASSASFDAHLTAVHGTPVRILRCSVRGTGGQYNQAMALGQRCADSIRVNDSLSVDRVRAVEEVDPGPVADAQQVVVAADFAEFHRHPFGGGSAVQVALFDHEGAGGHQHRQFGVAGDVAHVPFGDFVLAREDVAVAVLVRRDAADPVGEVGRAD